MGPADQVQIVLLQEICHDFGTKDVRDSSLVLFPFIRLVIWVGPQDVDDQLLLGRRHLVDDLKGSLDLINLLEFVQCASDTTVEADDLVVDDGGER